MDMFSIVMTIITLGLGVAGLILNRQHDSRAIAELAQSLTKGGARLSAPRPPVLLNAEVPVPDSDPASFFRVTVEHLSLGPGLVQLITRVAMDIPPDCEPVKSICFKLTPLDKNALLPRMQRSTALDVHPGLKAMFEIESQARSVRLERVLKAVGRAVMPAIKKVESGAMVYVGGRGGRPQHTFTIALEPNQASMLAWGVYDEERITTLLVPTLRALVGATTDDPTSFEPS